MTNKVRNEVIMDNTRRLLLEKEVESLCNSTVKQGDNVVGVICKGTTPKGEVIKAFAKFGFVFCANKASDGTSEETMKFKKSPFKKS